MFVKCLFQMAGTDTAVLEQTSGKPRNRIVYVVRYSYNIITKDEINPTNRLCT